jgi:3-methyladenine DNA glycosylase AlkD
LPELSGKIIHWHYSFGKLGCTTQGLLATMVDDPRQVTVAQMEKWVREFDSWDIVDGCCGNLFDKTPFAVAKAKEWCKREEEFEKRAGFVLMAERCSP